MKKRDFTKPLDYIREELPPGGYRLICENGAVITVELPFPTGERGDAIRSNASKTAYAILERIESEKVADA